MGVTSDPGKLSPGGGWDLKKSTFWWFSKLSQITFGVKWLTYWLTLERFKLFRMNLSHQKTILEALVHWKDASGDGKIVLFALFLGGGGWGSFFNSTIFQHPDQKPGCRKFWRLSGFARSKRVGCVTCICESYLEFPSLTIHLIHDVHASALWRSIRIF